MNRLTLSPPSPLLAEQLNRRFPRLAASDILLNIIAHQIAGRPVITSSFGAEAAVLMALVADIDQDVPILFLETGKLFPETLAYRDRLVTHLGLTNVQEVKPDKRALETEDPKGDLHKTDPDRCCFLRKTLPLKKALTPYDVWVTGRKRFQGETRADLPFVELSGQHLKVNPLADWTKEQIDQFFLDRDLPYHSLTLEGFTSIGCAPCTGKPQKGADPRSGRWAGHAKTECGIHFPIN